MWPERARTASGSGSAPSARARLRPHLAGATPEQHRVFLLRARAAAAHRHGLLPRTLRGSPSDDFRHGASGTGRVRWPGGGQRPPTRVRQKASALQTPLTAVSPPLSPLHLSSSSFSFFFPPSSLFLFIFQVRVPHCSSASLYSLGRTLLTQVSEFGDYRFCLFSF